MCPCIWAFRVRYAEKSDVYANTLCEKGRPTRQALAKAVKNARERAESGDLWCHVCDHSTTPAEKAVMFDSYVCMSGSWATSAKAGPREQLRTWMSSAPSVTGALAQNVGI
jgi:hypothetical protein